MNSQAQAILAAACQETIHRFYLALDAGDYETLARQMLPDGIWERQGETLKGRTAIKEALGQREPGVVSAHMVHNLVLDSTGPDTAKASMYVLILRHQGAEAPALPVPMPPLRTLQRVTDKLVLTAEGWRIAHKSAYAVFRNTALA